MKSLIKSMVLFLMIVGVVTAVTGCKPNEPGNSEIENGTEFRSESEIERDALAVYLENDNVFAGDEGNVEVTSILRLTTGQEDSETVQVEVVASNEQIAYKTAYNLQYRLVEGEWVYTGYTLISSKYKILKCPITADDALRDLDSYVYGRQSSYTDFEVLGESIDLETGYCLYAYGAIRTEGYTKANDIFEVSYRFSVSDGWTLEPIGVSFGAEEWAVEGMWDYHSSSIDLYLTIHKFSEDEAKIEYFYTVDGNTFQSTRVETCQVYEVHDNDEELYFYIGSEGEKITISKYQGVMYGDGEWMSYGNVFLLRKDSDPNYELVESWGAFPDVAALSDYSVVTSSYGRGGQHRTSQHTTISDFQGNVFYDAIGYMNEEDPADINTITYDIYEKYRYISGTVFLGSYAQVGATGTFRIYGDGVLLYEYSASEFTETDCSEDFVVDITGVRELTIELPGTYCWEKITGWGSFEYPVLYVANLILTKTEPYDFYGYFSNETNDVCNYIKSDVTLLKGLDYFYKKTGVRPYIAFIAYDRQMLELNDDFDYVLSDYAVTYAKNLCSELLGDEPYFALCYFAEEDDTNKSMGGWKCICYSTGEKSLAGYKDLFWDCLNDPEMSYSTFAERYSLAFTRFADELVAAGAPLSPIEREDDLREDAAGKIVAAMVGDTELTVAELGYYYYNARHIYFLYGYKDSDIYDEETGRTYHDHYLELALTNAQRVQVLYEKAIEDGYSKADVAADMERRIEGEQGAAESNGYDYGTWLRAFYGHYVTPAVFEDLITRDLLATLYYSDTEADMGASISDEELEAYYAEHMNGIDRDENPSANIRYIYIAAETAVDENGDIIPPSDNAWAAAKSKAEQILAEYKIGEMTADAFGALAEKYSADSGSNTNGGRYEHVIQGDLVEELDLWLFSNTDDIQPGDTALIRHDGDAEKEQDPYWGYHIIYLESWGEVVWKLQARDSMVDEAMNNLVGGLCEEAPAQMTAAADGVGK